MSPSSSASRLVPSGVLWPFALVTLLFALWGFANDVTNPLVKAFQDVFLISSAQSSLVQTAFYGGYATMALPAALFIRRYSYKAGIMVGLCLYATGAFIAIPAAASVNFNLFLVALYVLTFGLAFLETTANPYILSMGPGETATRRLNLAQAFNPIGSLTGMTIASFFILSNLEVEDFRAEVGAFQAQAQFSESVVTEEISSLEKWMVAEEAARAADPSRISFRDLPYDTALAEGLTAFRAGEISEFRGRSFDEMQREDLRIIRTPYVVIGLVVMGVLVVFALTRMPDTATPVEARLAFFPTLRILLRNRRYREGVIAQGFYVGAQIMCWTFIIHYATSILGMSAARAQNHNIVAMVIFCLSRFICTFVLKFFSPGKLLFALSLAAVALLLGVIFLPGLVGLYCLIGVSACMSLMFPTIYGIALDGMDDEAKIGSAGLIFAIVGGALMPPLQGAIIDLGGRSGLILGLPAASVSFVLPLFCFLVIALYGWRTFRIHHERAESLG